MKVEEVNHPKRTLVIVNDEGKRIEIELTVGRDGKYNVEHKRPST